MTSDSMGDRFKEYENVFQLTVPKRVPKILRLDGKAFHTLLKEAEKPYDNNISFCMVEGIKAVMQEIGGICVFCYTQSDEATFVINDYLDIHTESWFRNRVQKIVSVSASIMSVAFTQAYNRIYDRNKIAVFDGRLFIVPETEINNAILWRQFDATKNSVQSYARSFFSHKSLHKLTNAQMQEKMMTEKGFNWNDAPTWTKRGIIVKREQGKLVVDMEIPQFNVDTKYLTDLFFQKGKEVKE